MKDDYLLWVILAILLLVALFFCADFAGSKPSGPVGGMISARTHKAAHTEVWTTTDSKGKTEVHTTYHPEEWHLIVVLDGGGTEDTAVTMDLWAHFMERDRVICHWKSGSYSGARYCFEVQPAFQER